MRCNKDWKVFIHKKRMFVIMYQCAINISVYKVRIVTFTAHALSKLSSDAIAQDMLILCDHVNDLLHVLGKLQFI